MERGSTHIVIWNDQGSHQSKVTCECEVPQNVYAERGKRVMQSVNNKNIYQENLSISIIKFYYQQHVLEISKKI